MDYIRKPVTEVFADCKSPVTRKEYPKRLKKFFEHLGLAGTTVDEQGQVFLDRARQTQGWANEVIRDYILMHRERCEAGEITAGTLVGFLTPIKVFVDGFDDITATVNWKRIKKGMPTVRHYAEDRAPTIDEAKKLFEFQDRRIKPIVLIMLTSGMRIRGFNSLRYKHIKPKYDEKTGELLAAEIQIFHTKGHNYRSYITPECYREIEKYMQFRQLWGEQIGPESWVIRNKFRTADTPRSPSTKNPHYMNGGVVTKAQEPRQLTASSINRLVVRGMYETGVRELLQNGEKRHEVHGAHGWRKAFKTLCEYAGTHTIVVEMLMGHAGGGGLNANYFRLKPEQILKEYCKAVPALTVMEEPKTVQELKHQQEQFAKKTEEKDKQIEELRAEQNKTRELLNTALAGMAQMLKATMQSIPAKGITKEQRKQRADIEVQLKRLGVL